MQLVELQLAKLAQRIKVRVDRHEAPSTRLLDAVLELLAQPEAPLLACCKVLMASLDVFSRLVKEYDPNEHPKAFCLVLTILRRLCSIGGKPAVGRQADSNVTSAAGDQGVDANGYRLQGVRERMLLAHVVDYVVDAALVSREKAIDAAVVSFLCDFALEVEVCEYALPDALLRLLTNSRCHCKRTACILITRICSDSAARMVLLNADAEPSSREWITLALPQFWIVLLDTSPSLQTASLRVQAAETIVQLYLSLSDTEVGHGIANTLSSLLLACTTEDGMKIMASSKYQVMNNDDDEADANMANAGAAIPLLITITEIVARVILEVNRQHSADNEVVLAPLREQGLLLALCVSILRARGVEKREKENLETLTEQFDASPLSQQASLYTPLAQQRNRVRDLETQVEALFGVLDVWSAADDELLWSVRVMLQRHRFPDDNGPIVKLLSTFFNNDDAAAALNKELVHELQQSFRLAALKRTLDDAVRACSIDKRRAPIVYEPALLDIVHPSDTLPTFTTTMKGGDESLGGEDSSALGYLLLKRLYERNGYDGLPTKEDEKAILLALHPTSSDPHEHSKQQSVPIDFSGAGAVHLTDEELDMTLKKMTYCGLRPGSHKNHGQFLETASLPTSHGNTSLEGRSPARSKSPRSPKSKSMRTTSLNRAQAQSQEQKKTPTKPSSMKPARASNTGSLATRRQVQVNSPVPPQSQSRGSGSRNNELNLKVTGNVIEMDKSKMPSVQARLAPYCLDTLLALADNATYITQPQSDLVQEIQVNGSGGGGVSQAQQSNRDFIDVLRVDGANLSGEGTQSLDEYMRLLGSMGPPRETAPIPDVQQIMIAEDGDGSNQKDRGKDRGKNRNRAGEKQMRVAHGNGGGSKKGMVLEKIKIVKKPSAAH